MVSLPLSFASQFWSEDYRAGIESLYKQLDAGVVENGELLSLIRSRSAAHRKLGIDLAGIAHTPPRKNGWARDQGFSVKLGYDGLLNDTDQHARHHHKVAAMLDEIHTRYQNWSIKHEDRITDTKTFLMERLSDYESVLKENNKLHDSYVSRCRDADEAEQEARPNDPRSPNRSSNSAKPSPLQEKTESSVVSLTRSFTRRTNNIAQTVDRLRRLALEKEHASSGNSPYNENNNNAADTSIQEDVDLTKATWAEKGKYTQPNESADRIDIADILKTPAEWNRIFSDARDRVPKHSIRVPIVGTYDDAVSGQDLVLWFNEHLPDLEKNIDKSFALCRQITEAYDMLRLVGEIGNQFHGEADSYYIWRSTSIDDFIPLKTTIQVAADSSTSPTETHPNEDNSATTNAASEEVESPTITSLRSRSTSVADYLSTALQSVSGSTNKEPKHDRARRLANEAELNYRNNVRELDKMRLTLEEHMSGLFPHLQRWELERLRTIKFVIKDINATFSRTLPDLQKTARASLDLEEAIVPDRDLQAMIEANRTGPFKPIAHIWTDHYGEDYDVNFGIDLLRWFESPSGSVDIHPVFTALLNRLKDGYENITETEARRKIWLYDVPLDLVHWLRSTLNDANRQQDLIAHSSNHRPLRDADLPVVASTAKVWLLELEPPLIPYAYQDDIKALFKANTRNEENKLYTALQDVLVRLPWVYLHTLDAFIGHLSTLSKGSSPSTTIRSEKDEPTDTPEQLKEEKDANFYAKLGLSLGRCIMRPQMETQLSISDRTPTQLLSTLVEHYESILVPTISAKRQRDSNQTAAQRAIPQRKRTAPVDVRIRRSQLRKERLEQEEQLRRERQRQQQEKQKRERGPLPPLSSEALDRPLPTEPPAPPPSQSQRKDIESSSLNNEEAEAAPDEDSFEEAATKDGDDDDYISEKAAPRSTSPANFEE